MEHNIQQSLFFDIETTGLSADISAITVIGCCDMDGNVTQWFNEDGLSFNFGEIGCSVYIILSSNNGLFPLKFTNNLVEGILNISSTLSKFLFWVDMFF